ncbi:unnamed protein product [Linum trigynum]|uniref:RNase H type-1 domain-containing protein n=1 Tax=Linum trigynum TaxID=586398 RepID=A0AAV2EU51_9ROSI
MSGLSHDSRTSFAEHGCFCGGYTRNVVGTRGMWYVGLQNSMLVEALALRDAIHWCQNKGFDMVRIEGDAKVVIDKVNVGVVRDETVGALLEEIRHLLVHAPVSE